MKRKKTRILTHARESALAILNSVRVRSGDLNVGFHHHRLGWKGSVRRLTADGGPELVELPDPVYPEIIHGHYYEERAVWEIKNAYVHRRTGLVTVNRNAIRDSVRSHTSRKTPRIWLPRLGPKARFKEDIVFNSHQPRNYYHWLFEDFPSILRAKTVVPRARVILSSPQPPYVFQTLRMAGIDSTTQVSRDIRGTTVILAAQNADTGWPHPDDIKLVRSVLGPSVSVPEIPQRDIYLSRPPGRRGFINEDRVREFMETHGLEVVAPERLSLEEQFALFASARTIVGAHGAALTNLIFCQPHSRVLELALDSRAIQTYECLAYFCELDYSRVLLPTISAGEQTSLSEKTLNQVSDWITTNRN